MRDPTKALLAFDSIDELSRRKSLVHDRHPVALCLVSAGYLLIIASYGRHQVSALLPFFAYPVITMALSELPPGQLLRRLAFTSPLLLGLGALNPLFERTMVNVGPWTMAAGWLSFASLGIRLYLTVSAAYLLVATIGMDGLAKALRVLHVPAIIVIVFVTTYRYLELLLSEIISMLRAYELRSTGSKSIAPSIWGPMLGGLFMRTHHRATRIHAAMCLRQFRGVYPSGNFISFKSVDVVYCLLWLGFFILARTVDLGGCLGNLTVSLFSRPGT
ncbi:hypothetical protein MASR2M48_00400 [Spirochaetota bacterium]